MSEQEIRLLRSHNSYFTKPAVSATIFDRCRFFVTYADGSIKYDYECGSFSDDLLRAANIF